MKGRPPKKCERCGAEIHQCGRGRPRKYCEACRDEAARLKVAVQRRERKLREKAGKRGLDSARRSAASRLAAFEAGVRPDPAPVTVTVYRGARMITRGRIPGGPSGFTNYTQELV